MEKKKLFEKLANEELLFEDIFTNKFMKLHTQFSSFGKFTEELEERGSKAKGQTKQDTILQAIISEKTDFKNFEKMKDAAIEYYCNHY